MEKEKLIVGAARHGGGVFVNWKRIVRTVLLAALAFFLIGAKSCEVKSQSDIIKSKEVAKAVPEIAKLADKFDIKKYGNTIRLTTYDTHTFQEAIALLKKTPMNKPVLFHDNNLGELKTEITEDNIMDELHKDIFHYYDRSRPYKGIIYLYDGWWSAIEMDSFSMFITEDIDAPLIISVTEYCYANT
ncbi:MAG: hypothetical protein LBD07_02980, partial [Spirochaetaceae bacterium]|nr:hypothetical protein [Spirochaetaceae bacterium]